MGLVTFAVRYPALALVGKMPLPARVSEALRYVPPAVLAAIIVPTVLMPNGPLEISLQNTRLLAGLVAAGVAWKTRNLLLTIVLGMGALLVLNWLMEIR
jgi:branched-subunit amino acid transport protein